MSPNQGRTVVFVDVDDTCLYSTEYKQAQLDKLMQVFGPAVVEGYHHQYERSRQETGIVNPNQAFAWLCEDMPELSERHAELHSIILDFPHEQFMCEDILEVLRHVRQIGLVVLVSDGQLDYQMKKIHRCGLHLEVDGIEITHDKTLEFERLMDLYPAEHYIMVDDKPKVIIAMKRLLGKRATTILPRQGKYAEDIEVHGCPEADIILDRIGQLVQRLPLPCLAA